MTSATRNLMKILFELSLSIFVGALQLTPLTAFSAEATISKTSTTKKTANMPNIVNLGELLDLYLRESSKLELKQKVKSFQKLVVARHPKAFDKLVFQGKTADKFLEEQLPRAELSFVDGVALAKDFQPVIDSILTSYKRLFPKADYNYTLLLLPSFTFDGRADELADGTILVAFGLDRLARYKREDLKIVVAHEMFHALQMQNIKLKTGRSMALTDVWHEIWVEGLATYASGVITGLKTIDDVLGNKNVDGCKSDLPKEKSYILANFDRKTSDVSEQMDRWFGGHQFAYCLGYLAIADIAKQQSLEALLEWELTPHTRSKLYDQISAISAVK